MTNITSKPMQVVKFNRLINKFINYRKYFFCFFNEFLFYFVSQSAENAEASDFNLKESVKKAKKEDSDAQSIEVISFIICES